MLPNHHKIPTIRDRFENANSKSKSTAPPKRREHSTVKEKQHAAGGRYGGPAQQPGCLRRPGGIVWACDFKKIVGAAPPPRQRFGLILVRQQFGRQQ